MTDYTKLVHNIRAIADELDCKYCGIKGISGGCKSCVLYDAADAIEALQAEQKKTVTQIFGEEQMAWEGRCKDLMYQIADLQAQLPKRGERKTTRPDAPMFGFYYCSICGRRRISPQDNYCPNCGADMRAKMEVQE